MKAGEGIPVDYGSLYNVGSTSRKGEQKTKVYSSSILFDNFAISIKVSWSLLCTNENPEGFELEKPSITESGLTPLLYAAFHNRIDVVTQLLELGASVSARFDLGYSVMHELCTRNETNFGEMTTLLARNGADLDALADDGISPLLIALSRGNDRQAICLIENGANINLVCSPPYTALHDTSSQGNFSMTKYLLGRGADTEVRSYEGCTALLYASYQDHSDIVRVLLEARADPNAALPDESTALFIACTVNANLEIVRDLLTHGADPNQPVVNGTTTVLQYLHHGDRLQARS